MKKILLLILTLMLLLPAAALADEVDVTWKKDGTSVKGDILCDGDDSTVLAMAAATQQSLVASVSQGVQTAYVRTNSKLEKVELQGQNADGKWVTVAAATDPAPEFLLQSDAPISGQVRVLFTYKERRATKLHELRLFTGLEIADGLRAWENTDKAEVLVLVDDLTAFDATVLDGWASMGCRVALASLTSPEKEPLTATDALWNAGLRIAPEMGGFKASSKKADATLKNWGKDNVTDTVSGWLRAYTPDIVVNAGNVVSLVLEDASAAWKAPQTLTLNDDVFLAISDLSETLMAEMPVEEEIAAAEPAQELPAAMDVPEAIEMPETIQMTAAAAIEAPVMPDPAVMRPEYLEGFASATHSDVSLIPYPANRDAEGYLLEGEFVYENAEQGLWAYLSPTVQVQIVQHIMTSPAQRYFVSVVKFKPEQEQFKQHVYVNATFKNQQIWPNTLAQTSKMVFAINGDYYIDRKDEKKTGNIIRNREVLYNKGSKNLNFPPLETMALHDDGTISVYGANEITADALLAMGNVHDALSFGPYVVRDGVLRDYTGKNYDHKEPRTALGMIEAGHYIVITCEGRVPAKGGDKGAKGLDINEIGRLLYGYGCEEGFLLDGGSTSVLIFMGERLNRIGKNDFIGSPRNQHELFGVGTSELVHTDWVNGKPK